MEVISKCAIPNVTYPNTDV